MDDSMPLVAAIALLGMPVAAWIVVRGMEHAERMEMIRRGMTPPPHAARLASAPSLAGVLVLALFSIALLAAAWLIGLSAILYQSNAQPPYAIIFSVGIAIASFAVVRALRMRSCRRLRALPPGDRY